MNSSLNFEINSSVLSSYPDNSRDVRSLISGSDHVMLRIDDKWTCSECGFSRKQKSHVREHVESVHLKLTVICPVCEREVLKSGYRVHRRVHNPL